MSKTLKKAIDLKIALTIAVGVFGGLFVYRLFMWSHEWWRELRSSQQEDIYGFAILAVIIGLLHYGLRRLVTKLNQATPPTAVDREYWLWSRRKHAVRSVLASVFSFWIITAIYLEAWVAVWILAALGVAWILFRFRARVRRVNEARSSQVGATS